MSTHLPSTADDAFDLPVEIWHDIIDFATNIPGAFTLRNYFDIETFCEETHGISVGSAFQNALAVKLALSGTSKFFNRVVQRFLLRYIRITSPKQVLIMSKSLESGIRHGGITQMGLERWTIRVEVAVVTGYVWMPEHTAAICYLLGFCKSMTSFSSLFTSIPGGQLGLPEILKCLGSCPSLRRLETRVDGDIGHDLQPLRSFLEVLCWRGKSRNSISHEFPQLRVLITNSDSGNPKQIIAPKLLACVVASGGDFRMTTPQPDIKVDAKVVEYLSPCLIQKDKLSDLPNWTSLKAIRFTYCSLVNWDCIWPNEGSVIPSLECVLIDGFLMRLPDGTRGRFGSGYLQENLKKLSTLSMFPNLRTFKLFLGFLDPVLQAWIPTEDRDIWSVWFSSLSSGQRVFISRGQAEWVGNRWVEFDGQRAFAFW
ncbi:hypothetical protein CPB83DRAFT_950203 [Crepidotus variabilis]|uniref:Uncharacterized protein n=1 Tax=Crepidotus variabilis TaxID=179855 RepID=A0A9P6EM45_9AGAR|nr:hypothetical protein CPB83DRAFT_950203 [Crepidotus variabilis]